MFGLLGPNGAGKSTLMQVVAGILEPTSGEVLLDGVEITEHPAHVWERLGYLPQDFGFYGHLSGRAMLAHLLRLKGVRAPGGLRKLCAELLERVNLSDAAGRKVKGYSGGMIQRLGIAQAIAGDPRILIVDEPTAGLDPEERQRFYRVLAELARERIVLLFRTCTSRLPEDEEVDAVLATLAAYRERFAAAPEDVAGLLELGRSSVAADTNPVELGAWTLIASAVLNLHETLTQD